MHLCYGSKDFFPEQKKTWYFTGSINLKAKNATISVVCSWTLKWHPRIFPVPLKAYSYVVICKSSFPRTLCPKKFWGQPLILFKLKKMCAEEKLERRCWEGILKKNISLILLQNYDKHLPMKISILMSERYNILKLRSWGGGKNTTKNLFISSHCKKTKQLILGCISCIMKKTCKVVN